MKEFRELAREYEARRFPLWRRLDLQAEGPATARERALYWIQSQAHEEPGEELLLILERGVRPGRPHGAVWRAVERLLVELEGRLIEWWQPFGDGSIAVRLADVPRFTVYEEEPAPDEGDGRTADTAGTAVLAMHHDIPDELMEQASRIAEIRRNRERLSVGVMDVVLRRVWIDAQAVAMEERISFELALDHLLTHEQQKGLDDD